LQKTFHPIGPPRLNQWLRNVTGKT